MYEAFVWVNLVNFLVFFVHFVLRARVRHIMLVNLTIMLKIMLLSDHYARVMLVEISPLNPRYHPNESPNKA